MIGNNTLPTLAAEIRVAHQRVRASAIEAAEQAIRAGHLLVEARALVRHGAWAQWLQANVGFSDRSARRYMQIARAGLNSATVAEIGLRRSAEALAEGRGPIPICADEIEVFASIAMDYHEPFAAIREVSPGWFEFVVLADDEFVTAATPIAQVGLETALSIATAGRLSPATWCWRYGEHDMFSFLAGVVAVDAAGGKQASLAYAKREAFAFVDQATARLGERQ